MQCPQTFAKDLKGHVSLPKHKGWYLPYRNHSIIRILAIWCTGHSIFVLFESTLCPRCSIQSCLNLRISAIFDKLMTFTFAPCLISIYWHASKANILMFIHVEHRQRHGELCQVNPVVHIAVILNKPISSLLCILDTAINVGVGVG